MKYVFFLSALLYLVLVGTVHAVYVYEENADTFTGFDGQYSYEFSYNKPPTAQYGTLSQSRNGINTSDNTSLPGIYNTTIDSDCWNLSSSVIEMRIFARVIYNTNGSSVTNGATSELQCLGLIAWNSASNPSVINSTGAGTATQSLLSNGYLFFDGDYTTGEYCIDPAGGTPACEGTLDGDFGEFKYISNLTNQSSQSAMFYEEGMWWYYNNSLNITFYDEITGLVLSGTTITYYATNGLNTKSGTTSTGSALMSDLYYDNYTVTYSATGYQQRSSTVFVQYTQTNASLYLINTSDSTTILATVYNTFGRRVESVDIFLNKKNLSASDSYYTVETCTTNALGQCLLHVDLYDTVYRFLLYYGGELALNSNDTQLSSTEIVFNIVTSSTGLGEIFDQAEYVDSLTYDNSSEVFTYTFNDPSLAYSQICLSTIVRTDSNIETYSSNCTTAHSGSLSLAINSATGDEWTGSAYGYTSSDSTLTQLRALSVVVDDFLAAFGVNGLYLFGFILVGVIGLSGLAHPIIPPVLMAVLVWVLNALGFLSVGTSAAISLVAVAVIIIIINKRT